MRFQLIESVDPGRDSQDRHAELLRRQDVIRGVANEANLGLVAEMRGRLLHGVAENIVAELVAIAETPNRETITNPRRLELGPANALQVSGTHADEFPVGKEGIEQLAN